MALSLQCLIKLYCLLKLVVLGTEWVKSQSTAWMYEVYFISHKKTLTYHYHIPDTFLRANLTFG